MIKRLLSGTLLSALIFFSISFMTVLLQINSPIHRYETLEHKIGFPLVYYHEFMVDCPIPNAGWNLVNLVLDIGITWIIVTGLYIVMKRPK